MTRLMRKHFNNSTKFFFACLTIISIATCFFAGCNANTTDPALQRLKHLSAPERDKLMKALITSYKDTFKMDSVNIVAKGDTESVQVKHYCLHDGQIDIPVRYLAVYGLSTFKTHNFVSEVEFKINSKIIFKGIISKKSFNSLDEDLQKYGVLSLPDVAISGKAMLIAYGIVIPLTDYTKGYIIGIDSTGRVKYNSSLD